MADIDKSLNEAPLGEQELLPEELEAPIEIEVQEEDQEEEELPVEDFSSNLAEVIDEPVLAELSNELRGQFAVDNTSREDWEKAYIKGLDLLGFKYQEVTEPF